MRPFRPGFDGELTRLGLLALTSWGTLRVGLQLGSRPSALLTLVALGAGLASRLPRLRRAPSLSLHADALHLATPTGTRAIPLDSLTRWSLVESALQHPDGPWTLTWVRLEVRDGPPLGFADLSPLGGGARTLPGTTDTLTDVDSPELLARALAGRVKSLELQSLLPDASSIPLPSPGPWRAPSPGSALRLVVVALVLVRALAALPHALHSARPALTVGAWALSLSLALALPSWPLPGHLLARRLGARLAARAERQVNLCALALGALAAWLYATGMLLLPTALVAGAMEAREGLLAERRHALLATPPGGSEPPLEALATLRYRLRARPVSAAGGRHSLAQDLASLREALTPPRGRLGPALALTLAGCALASAVAVASLYGDDPAPARAIRWLLQ